MGHRFYNRGNPKAKRKMAVRPDCSQIRSGISDVKLSTEVSAVYGRLSTGHEDTSRWNRVATGLGTFEKTEIYFGMRPVGSRFQGESDVGQACSRVMQVWVGIIDADNIFIAGLHWHHESARYAR